MNQKQEIIAILRTVAATNAELADHLMTSTNTVSVLVSQLRRDGYAITSEPTNQDRRQPRYRLETGESE